MPSYTKACHEAWLCEASPRDEPNTDEKSLSRDMPAAGIAVRIFTFSMAGRALAGAAAEGKRDHRIGHGPRIPAVPCIHGWKGGLDYLKRYHYAVLLVIFFMLRELDFDKKFTTMGVLKSKFYVSPVVPVAEKAIGAMVIALLIYAAVQSIRRHARGLVHGLRRDCVVSLGVFLVGVFLVVSKSLDGIARKLNDIGIGISAQTSDVSAVIEEVLEFGIPLILMLAAAAFFKNGARAVEKEVYRQAEKVAEEKH